MLTTYAALADRIQALPPRAGSARVVAVDGPAGSGKTEFARRLASALGAPVVHLDDLCPGWSGLAKASARLVEWILAPLAAGRSARYRRYDWERERYAEWHYVPSAPVVVIDGVTSGSRAVAAYLSLLVWVDAPLAVRMVRGIERDREASRGRWERWVEQEAAIFWTEGTQERADLKVDGAPTDAHNPERAFVTDGRSDGDGA